MRLTSWLCSTALAANLAGLSRRAGWLLSRRWYSCHISATGCCNVHLPFRAQFWLPPAMQSKKQVESIACKLGIQVLWRLHTACQGKTRQGFLRSKKKVNRTGSRAWRWRAIDEWQPRTSPVHISGGKPPATASQRMSSGFQIAVYPVMSILL